jgi:hypothetical protein
VLFYLRNYCNYYGYDINENLIIKDDNVIGHINPKEKWVIIGNNKLKYGDFAVLIAEGYFDILGENNVI